MAAQIPRQGDVVILTFDPQSGHEQRGRRPAVVLSKELFNRHTGLCIACPITSTRRDHPMHVAVPAGGPVTGFVMVEQVKSLDFRARAVKRVGELHPDALTEVLGILDACIY